MQNVSLGTTINVPKGANVVIVDNKDHPSIRINQPSGQEEEGDSHLCPPLELEVERDSADRALESVTADIRDYYHYNYNQLNLSPLPWFHLRPAGDKVIYCWGYR